MVREKDGETLPRPLLREIGTASTPLHFHFEWYYHGTRTETHSSTSDAPIRGEVSDTYGQPIGHISGSQEVTTTTKSEVPYSFEYPVFTLSIETKADTEKWKVVHNFQRRGICPVIATAWGGCNRGHFTRP